MFIEQYDRESKNKSTKEYLREGKVVMEDEIENAIYERYKEIKKYKEKRIE